MPEPTVFNGRYELHRRLGRGGMAEVFLARDLQLDRPVAVKVLFTEHANEPAFVARFRREAQAAANLNHPNIVSVFDWGQEHGTYYIVMEYVDGHTLAEILRSQGPLRPEDAVRVAADTASALGHAHASGMLHRDIKPGNILVTPAGRVKVADWGIGRALDAAVEENLTQTGAVMGTATYFSPEQAQGMTLDPRSDLYALGVVLYESLTGVAPFTGDNPVAIAYKHVQEQPRPPRSLNLDIPPDLEAIVLQLLAKDPVDRYASAEALLDDLERFRQGLPVAAGWRGGVGGGAAGVEAAAASVGYEPTQAVVAPTAAVTEVAAGAGAAGAAGGGGYHDGTRLVPIDELPREYRQPPERRSWAFLVVLIVLLGVLAGLLVLLARTLGVADDGDDTEVAQIEVPDLVGQPGGDAQQVLIARGFDVDAEFVEVTEPGDIGNVISQDPEGGERVDEGSEVTITIGAAQLLPVPDLRGSLPDDAVATLQQLGFTAPPGQREEPSDEVERGQIIGTEPAAGEQAAADAVITFIVSSGPEQVMVPEIDTGNDECGEGAVNAAFSTLSAVGLVPQQQGTPSDDIDEGCIVDTDPPAGQEVDAESTVAVIVSTGPATEAVPDVVGIEEGAAVSAIQQAGFDVDVQRRPAEDGDTPGTVVAQDPSGQADAEPGSTVTIVVATEPEPETTTTTGVVTLPPDQDAGD